MSTGGLFKARLERMHDVLADRIEQGVAPGIVTVVSRRGEAHVDAIGTQDLAGGAPMRHDTIFRIASMTKPIAAAAAMILVEECRLRLDEPVDRLLPELGDRKVLKRVDGPLADTVPAHRPITLRDLLTMRMGFGMIVEPSGDWPIQRAMSEAGIDPGPNPPDLAPDELMRRFGRLPLMHQPGERWLYHSSFDILGVLIARAARRRLRRRAIRQHRAVRHRRGLPGLRPDDAERRPARRAAHSGPSERRGHDHRSDHARAEGGLAVLSRLLGPARLGLWRIDDHPARRRRRGARPLCLGRRLRHLLGFRSARGHGGYLMVQRLFDPAVVDLHADFWTLAYQAIGD